MSDEYEYWRACLAREDAAAPADRTHPPAGRWRTPRGEPLAVWQRGGIWLGMIGRRANRRRLTDNEMASIGEQGGHGTAITLEEYDAVFGGAPWPDMDLTVAAQLGDNNPPTDPFELLTGQIDAASAGTSSYKEITDDETSSRAQSLRSRLLELMRAADTEREQLKRPHLEAGKKIDAKWQPLVRAAKQAADYLAAKMSSWENAKVLRARLAAEERQRLEDEAQQSDITLPPSAPEPEPEAPPSRIRGAYGRAAAVKTVKVVEIINWNKAALYFCHDPAVQDAVRKAAQRSVAAGHDIPADIATIKDEKRIA